MSILPEEWMEQNADRIASRQRSEADNAKIAATFIAGVAATLVGTALQVDAVTRYDRFSVYLLGLTTLAALGVFLLDRISEVDHDAALADAKTSHWTDAEIIDELRTLLLWATRDNDEVIKEVKIAMYVEFLFAAGAGFCAVLGLLGAR